MATRQMWFLTPDQGSVATEVTTKVAFREARWWFQSRPSVNGLFDLNNSNGFYKRHSESVSLLERVDIIWMPCGLLCKTHTPALQRNAERLYAVSITDHDDWSPAGLLRGNGAIVGISDRSVFQGPAAAAGGHSPPIR